MPHVKTAWERRAAPRREARTGAPARDRQAVHEALLEDPALQIWSASRRLTMEQRQEAGRWTALRQAEILAARARDLTEDDDRLALNPEIEIPRYLSAVDHHCKPGSDHTEQCPGDVSNAARHDPAIFATTGGLPGRYSDGGGHAVVKSVRDHFPALKPRRSIEIAATPGHNLLPIAQAEDGDLPMIDDASVDWVQTTMFLHELSAASLRAIFRESHRQLRPDAVVLPVEQPHHAAEMPLFEQAMRDWDAFRNNQAFCSRRHEIDLDGELVAAGFSPNQIILQQEGEAIAADAEGDLYLKQAAEEIERDTP